MKICPKCGAELDDGLRFCKKCGSEYRESDLYARKRDKGDAGKSDRDVDDLIGDKNLINESTIIGKQEKYEASNITINNTVTEDHSHTTVVCSVSGKRVYLDHSVVCPECGKPVALEYYQESSKRCDNCEEKAREAFRSIASGIAAEGPLDAARKRRLDSEAKRLRIDDSVQTEILRTLQRRGPAPGGKLSTLQKAELETAVRQLMQLDEPQTQQHAMESLSVLHELTGNYIADCWYFLGLAVTAPEESVRRYEEEVTDIYWQRYWGYLAYCAVGSPKGGAAVERLRASFGEHEDDIRLAETAYCMARGFASFDRSMMKHAGEMAEQIRPEYLSQPLAAVYSLMKRVLAEDIRLDGDYTAEEVFFIVAVLRAGRYVERLQAEAQELARRQREEQERREREAREERERREREEREALEKREREARETRERQERERAAAEEAKRRKQAELAAERTRRMEQEMARLGGNKPRRDDSSDKAKAFAGYETTVPGKKKGGWKRTLLIVVIVLILILVALFLIPAPESLQ